MTKWIVEVNDKQAGGDSDTPTTLLHVEHDDLNAALHSYCEAVLTYMGINRQTVINLLYQALTLPNQRSYSLFAFRGEEVIIRQATDE